MTPRPCLICGSAVHHTRNHRESYDDTVRDLDAACGYLIVGIAGILTALLLFEALLSWSP